MSEDGTTFIQRTKERVAKHKAKAVAGTSAIALLTAMGNSAGDYLRNRDRVNITSAEWIELQNDLTDDAKQIAVLTSQVNWLIKSRTVKTNAPNP